MSETTPAIAGRPTAGSASRGRSPGWARLLLIVSLVVSGLGLGSSLLSGDAGNVREVARTVERGAASLSGNPPASDPDTGAGTEREKKTGSSAAFRLGFSFAAAFGAAYAARAFVRHALLAVGVFGMALAGLNHTGLIEIRWGEAVRRHDSMASFLGAQTESAKALLTGAVPSSMAAGAGFFAGWRRKR